MCDGNRRWARENGFEDVSHGHRMGALKISEMLGWCDAAGIEMATIYLLSTENLRRDPGELDTLLEIITDVVEEISGPDKNWSVKIVGALDLLPSEQSRRLRDAAAGTEGRTGTHVNVAIGYGGRQEIADAVQSLLSEKLLAGLSGDELVKSITVDGIDGHLYTSGQPDPDLVIRTSGSSGCRGSCCGRAPTPRSGSPRHTGPSSAGSTSSARSATTPPGTAASASDVSGEACRNTPRHSPTASAAAAG